MRCSRTPILQLIEDRAIIKYPGICHLMETAVFRIFAYICGTEHCRTEKLIY